MIQREVGWISPPPLPLDSSGSRCRPYIRVYAYRPRATDHANLAGNSILFFFLLHARNFERTSSEIDERERERGRDGFLLNWRRFRDEDGFFQSPSIFDDWIRLGLDFDFLIKNSIFLRWLDA